MQKLGGCVILYIRHYICYPRWPLLHHSVESMNLKDHFNMLKKCRSTLDCLTYEMSYIRHLKAIANTQLLIFVLEIFHKALLNTIT